MTPPSLLAAGAVVAVVLAWRVSDPLTDRAVVALCPWVVAAAAAGTHSGQSPLAVLVRPPLGYLLALTVATTLWALLDRVSLPGSNAGRLALLGGVLALVGLWGSESIAGGSPVLGVATVALTVALTGGLWWRFGRYFPERREQVGTAGLVVVFGHLLDGITTAVGIDRLGLGEQTPLARMVLQTAEGVPVAPVVGVGWLFLLLKILLACWVLWIVPDYLSRSAHDRRFLFGLAGTLGFGPGVQNLLLLL